MTIVVGGQTLTATVNGGTWSVAVPVALINGSYNVQATAYRQRRKHGHRRYDRRIDRGYDHPTITILSLLVTNNTMPTLSGTVADPSPSSGIAGVTIVVGGQTLTATVSGTTGKVSVPVALADGTYEVQATATDNAGNVVFGFHVQ